MSRVRRMLAVGALIGASTGIVVGATTTGAGACPVAGNDGTVWGMKASVTKVGGDEKGLYDVDGDGNSDAPPSGVPAENWPFDTNQTNYDEKHKTVYVDDRDFTANLDDTLGPGQSLREQQIGAAIGNPGFNINVRDSKSGDEEGFWLYLEANSQANLQRGGNHVVFEETGIDEMDKIIEDEVVILPPDEGNPVSPSGVILFADDPDQEGDQSGFPSGGSLAQTAGEHDPCTEVVDNPNTPAVEKADTILF